VVGEASRGDFLAGSVVQELLVGKKFPALDYFQRGPVVIVAAHPDDETIGLGGQFAALNDPYVIHLTDGAPRSTPDREAYAALRRRELEAAMDIAGVDRRRCFELGAVDQDSAFSLSSLTRLLAARLVEILPEVIISHPYEGGHPDHDACAFVVQIAVRLLQSAGRRLPLRIEFGSYHNGAPFSDCAYMTVGEFLPGPPAATILLSFLAQERKQRMFRCFETQQHVLGRFPIDRERFRLAPWYEFSQPPHPGKLFYEDKNWGVTGSEWRRLAATAEADLGVGGIGKICRGQAFP
jgi:LmbE family N-acetylglucosaminyl deacetylase